MSRDTKAPGRPAERELIRVVFVAAGLAALAVTLWAISDVLLLVFGAILLAVALRALMELATEPTGLPDQWALLLVLCAILAVLVAALLFFGRALESELEYLISELQVAVGNLQLNLNLDNLGSASAIGDLMLRALTWGSTVLGAAASLILVFVAGIYFAAAPEIYRGGLVKLFPPAWHGLVNTTLDESHEALRGWLKGQLLAMAIVGTLTGIGMWLVGVPSPVALGLISGLTEFVPIIGPIVGAILALLLASTQGSDVVLWALAVAVAVQQVESNLITPLVMGKTVHVPPAVGLFALVALGVVFGPLGLLFGYPLAIVVDVAVRRLYVREALGEPVEITGEKARPVTATGRQARNETAIRS